MLKLNRKKKHNKTVGTKNIFFLITSDVTLKE